MIEPVISIVAPAIRPFLWQELYAMLCAENNVPFEIVYCGNVRPEFELPENFIHIFNESKPPLCYETAWRNAKGEFLLIIPDDVIVPPRTVDVMYSYMQRMQNEKAIISARFSDKLGGPPLDSHFCFDMENPKSPVLGCATMTRRKVWEELGGFDRRFELMWADTDLQMRILEASGHPFVVPSENYIIRERIHVYSRLADLTKGPLSDRILLDSLWKNSDGSTSETRLEPVQPYTKDEINIIR